jgi:hypothetical protein
MPSQIIAFPVNGERQDKVQSGSMHTHFTFNSNGNLYATTRTWTKVKLKGFTGGVFIALTDASGFPIWTTNQQRYGVDGTWIGQSDRTETWQASVPEDILPRVGGYAIIQEHTPRARVWEWILSEEGQRTIKAAVTIILMV